ncbi:peptidyl-prolyl cis-trans isomerase C [Xanthobacter sp. SG618]|uniref:peptidylprolyl isomerase n=1 Tax=Xanthobacter sp. SG618 TaxID=2587121 RepID=UPI00145CB7A6|nr:peptidylprolyl isomerase [Xanthobacter sp. SG618]NMN57229.1 peptidyl-prolyl cis-trans isomerase C [Xanthobacter sp. SG618]
MVEIVTLTAPRPAGRRPHEIRVDGIAISRADIAHEAQNHAAADPAAAWQAAAHALVVRQLLLAEADRLGIAAVPEEDDEDRCETEEEAVIRALLEEEVKVPTADEDTCRRYFARNPALFRTGDLYEVAHILIAADPADAGARQAARDQAEALLTGLLSGAVVFEAAAREASACPSREVGGSLGQIGRGQTVPEFETALAAMEPGALHPVPVETRYGFHIVRLAHRVAGRALPFEMVREAIAGHLELSSWHAAMRQYVSLLIGRADIRGISMEGAQSPLVQ